MPRSATDATRFTATRPYANSKTSSPSTINFGGPPSTNETPQQKVARLREAARRAKLGQDSTFDRVVDKGRVWADRAHRFVALGLIAATGICGTVAVLALGDMVLYNRRKRNEWLKDQQEEHRVKLIAAREAEALGTPSDDQMLLLNRERAAEEAETARKAKKGIFARAKAYLYSGLSTGEEQDGKAVSTGKELSEEGKEKGVEANGKLREVWQEVKDKTAQATSTDLGILEAVNQQRRTGEKVEETLHPTGGPLDREAENAAAAASNASKGWTSWMIRR
ncbi:hypothetical protein B0A49_08366 [Cryomyces minteri]|uniref:Cytochrome oxidase c assembly-domain-containing protein n=1 Tax=Cryomyces minteri TaxID=331657 RepID=A0A4U0X0M9_9PEZI|nr:hypothetical protein B0A49_08366 [Cryomyces minteri]